ncbi:Predicted transport protein [Cnuella takakiae]|uniref:Predicted transport protein n=1 Tax=Cnuella takakiae TaxID=1302690 RepID=A0A1M4TLX6_9BACT|nr:DUF5655 domain-containing protein [Cnuella takakiae]OLY90762.1 hypothetical protein BUE76_01745 [Cnuella takakiae]SHE45492.1 Predicted transport protein [Cnuella takakiae]
MPLFFEEQGKYRKLKIAGVNNEKSLQTLVENNLLEVLDMHFLASEYVTTFGGRIDTLAVDADGAPVIIEYKLSRNENVINQGLSYLRWLKAQKVEFFEMLLIKKLGKELAEQIKIDWDNPRVICIAESYSKFDLDTVEVIPMRIELFKYRMYERGLFSLEPLNNVERAQEKEKAGKPIVSAALVNPQVPDVSSTINELFEELRSRILQMDENITEKHTSYYVAYQLSRNFAEVHITKKAIKLLLRPVNYNDPKQIVEKVPDTYRWTMDRRVYLKSKDELDYIMSLIEQSYKDVL